MTEPSPVKSPEEEIHSTTYDAALDKIGTGTFQYLYLQICGSGWLVDGVYLTLVSLVLPMLQKEWKLVPIQVGALGSAMFIGMLFGAYIGGLCSDRFGRKVVLIIGMLICAVGGLVNAFALEFWSFFFLRVITGLGLGAVVPTEFAMYMELIPIASRAFLTNVMNIYWSIGGVYAVLLCWSAAPNWRLIVGLSSIPAWISLAMKLFIHESPRYLLIHNRTNDANAVVASIASWNKSPIKKFHLIDKSTHQEDTRTNICAQVGLLFSRELLLTSILLWIIWFATAYGSWGFSFILPLVFNRISPSTLYANMLIQVIFLLIGNFIGLALVEIIRRRLLIGISLIICAIFAGLVGAWSNNIYLLVLATIFNLVNQTPWAAMYIYTPEVYPTSCRVTGTGVTSVMNRLGGVVAPLVSELMLSTGYFLPFLTYGIALAVAGICAFLLPYETQSKALTDHVGDRKPEIPDGKLKDDASAPLIEEEPEVKVEIAA